VEGIGGDKIPTALDFTVIDEWMFVTDRDAMLLARRLAREEGLLVGGSTGVNLAVALDVARRLDDPNALVVTILCDTGERYLSKVFSDEWMRENQMLETEPATAATIIGAKRSGAPELVTVAPTATARQALNLMSTYDVSQLPVVESGDCVGAVTESTLTAQALADPQVLEQTVRELMEAPLPVVDAALPLERLTTLLLRDRPAVVIRRDGRLAGIVTRYDVLHHVAGIR
jgi:cystathionine beta-synthase